MSNIKYKQVRLAAFGFDNRSQESFRMTFKGPGKGKALLVDENSADFGIINLDSADSKRLLDEYQRRYPGRPAIKLSVKESEDGDALYIKKPAKIDDMLEAVDKLIQELGRQLQNESVTDEDGVAADQMDVTVPAAREITLKVREQAPVGDVQPASGQIKASRKARNDLFYNPKDYLQSEIHSAAEYANKSGLVVELWLMSDEHSWKKIVFLPRLQRVLTSMTDKELRAYCSSPLHLMNHKMYRRNEKETATIQGQIEKERRGISFEAFKWKTALYTSQGRLPEGTSVQSATQLMHWPNLTRLYPVAGSMRIATLLVDQPRPLPVIAKVLKMPAGRVFAFYSAACAIGIVGGGAVVEMSKPSMPERHRDHTLFGRILKRLKKNSDPDFEVYA